MQGIVDGMKLKTVRTVEKYTEAKSSYQISYLIKAQTIV